MADLPTGTVTFLFTDIVESTALLQRIGDRRYAGTLTEHQRLLRAAFEEGSGREVDTQGDAFLVAFPRARDALATAVAAQQALMKHPWPDGAPLQVRMGLHTGEPISNTDRYVGLDVHRASRICAAGHGGQILLSDAVSGLLARDLPQGVRLRDLGTHRLKDLREPEHLFQAVHPDLPMDFPPLRSLDARPHNLPVQLTSFIGREREKAEIRRLFSTTRFITLTGPGGAGKTRLGLQVAAEVLEEFPDGVWLIEFAPLSDPDLVAQTTAAALGVREQPGRPILSTLIDHLRPKHLHVVLDNCEHMLSACATLADAVLRACPDLRILATSREGLGVAGELTYRVPSLSVPDLHHLPAAERLVEHEAVRLFVERARFALPTFTMTEQNGRTVAQICHRLDGIPLAIELAAARVKSMSVERIAERLRDRFHLLTGGSRTALRRHQTLRNAIDWSYDLLSEPERIALRRLAVFAGGSTLEAAEAVCGGDSVTERDILDLLTHLVDKSLVMIEQDGEERYRMLETIREYALHKLVESGEAEEVRRRHRNFFLGLAEEGYAALVGSTAPQWLKRLQDEHDNIRNALRWSIDREDWEGAARLGGAMSRFWSFRGLLTEGRAWLQELLQKDQPISLRTRAKVLSGACLLAYTHGDFGDAVRLGDEGLAILRELGDQKELTVSLYRVGGIEMARGHHERAATLLEESGALARQRGDLLMVAEALRVRGHVAARRGDYGLATGLLEESLSLHRRAGAKKFSGWALRHLGLVKHYMGQSEQAVALLQEALVAFRDLEDPEGVSHALSALALVRRGVGDQEGAEVAYREALMVASEIGYYWGMIECLVGFAALSVSQGRGARSARLLAASEALQKTTEYALPVAEQAELDQMLEALRENLGEVAFAAAWAAGRAMTLEQAIAYALATEGLPS